jgi:hypothetical protein
MHTRMLFLLTTLDVTSSPDYGKALFFLRRNDAKAGFPTPYAFYRFRPLRNSPSFSRLAEKERDL